MGIENEKSGDGNKTESPSMTDTVMREGWNALQHASGISTVKAIFKTETVDNFLHDFQLVDDGTSGYKDLARKHVEESLNGSQRKNLEKERDSHDWKLFFSAVPVPGMPDTPDKGPLMKQFDERADEVVQKAKRRVDQEMTSDEAKKYHDEQNSYWWSQVANDVTLGLWPGSAEKGTMMKEYDKRVERAMKETSIDWSDKNA